MEDDKKNRFGIMPFAGTDFGNWFYRIKVILEEHDLLQEIEKTESVSSDKTKARKCKSIIVQSIADSHLELIKDLLSPKEIIKKLEDAYLSKGISSQLLARKRLLTLTFYLDFDKNSRNLRESGADPFKYELICYLLLAMPQSYGHIVSVIETINSKTLTMEFVRRRLLDEETKKKGLMETENTIEAFQTRKYQRNYI